MTRRALTNVGGPVRLRGDEELSAMLGLAWERAGREPPDVLTHGFHTWAARMHWAVARTVLEALAPRSVIDPFCGSGTVLVEARVAGAKALGVDLNPLAQRVCDVKLDPRDAEGRARLIASAEMVAERSEARVRQRIPIKVDLPKYEIEWYSPHVLKELGGLLEEIRTIDDAHDRRTLEIVFSSIVIKVSRQRSDTAERVSERRIRKGLATELFLRKTRELAERLEEYEAVAKGPMPKVLVGDARKLATLVKRERFDLVLTSPPYGGTYDYAAHHARRIAWLGLESFELRRRELGARRALSGDESAHYWERDVDAMLRAMVQVLRPGGKIVLVIGDAELGTERVDAAAQLARIARKHGLNPAALASQPRADWRGRAPRLEHLALLTQQD